MQWKTPHKDPLPVCQGLGTLYKRTQTCQILLPSASGREPNFIRNILSSFFPFLAHRFSYPVNQPALHLCLTLYPSFDVKFYYYFSSREFFFPNKFKMNKLFFLIEGQKSFSTRIFLVLFHAGLTWKIIEISHR